MSAFEDRCAREDEEDRLAELYGITAAQVRADIERYGHVAAWRRSRRGLFDMRRDLGRAPTAQEWQDERR